MPREKDFDQEVVIKKCIELFANNGYSATGIQEIVENTGINRSSLYSTFKGKDELFHTCLKKVMSEEIALLEGMRKKLPAHKLVNGYLDMVTRDKSGYHLLKFANAEYKLLDKKSQTTVNAHYQWKLSFLDGIFRQAQKNGKMTKKIDSKDMASLLETMVQGIQNFSPHIGSDKNFKKPALQFSKLIQKKKS